MPEEPFIVLEVETVGLREAITGLDYVDENLRDRTSLIRAMHTAVEESLVDLREATPVRSGKMSRGWRAETQDTGEPYKYHMHIFNDVDYAKYVVQGTGLYGPLKAPIIANRKAFSYTDIFGNRQVTWRIRGQRPNERLNQVINEEVREITVRAADREIRGLMGIAFAQPTADHIISTTDPFLLVE